jgi:hypothetical protein
VVLATAAAAVAGGVALGALFVARGDTIWPTTVAVVPVGETFPPACAFTMIAADVGGDAVAGATDDDCAVAGTSLVG